MINTHKLGLTLAFFFGLIHVLWSALVWFAWAQPLADWVSALHFMFPATLVDSFSFGQAFLLVIFSMFVGYVIGHVFGFIWNKVHSS